MLSESDIKEKVTTTEYWYFRFNEHFFDDIKIAQMETLPGGFEMLVILLKLYCLSVKERGMFRLPNANGEPDYEALAKLTRHPRRTLEMAIQYFVSMGFVEIIIGHDVGETIFKTPKLENMIGKSSKEADRKRLARSRQQQNELPENTDERKTKCDKYGVFNNVYLRKDEYKALDEKYKNANELIDRVSIYKEQFKKDYENDYAAVLSFAFKDGEEKPDMSKAREREVKMLETEASIGAAPPDSARELLGDKKFRELTELAEKVIQEERAAKKK